MRGSPITSRCDSWQPSILGAHVVPPAYTDRRDAYVRLLVEKLIPYIASEQLARCCDVFVDDMAFTVSEARRILQVAKDVGLAGKLHADQLTSCGGAELAAEMAVWSADHVECVSEEGIAALAASQVVAVSLPIAALYLQQPPMPARVLMAAGVPVAVATDSNPGLAPSYHLPLALTLACTTQHMMPAEALKACTIIAAKAIGLHGTIGSLEVGKAANFAVIAAPDVDHWLYHFRANACRATVCRGELCWGHLDGLGRSGWAATRVPAMFN
jgi:imidazolonepropionase